MYFKLIYVHFNFIIIIICYTVFISFFGGGEPDSLLSQCCFRCMTAEKRHRCQKYVIKETVEMPLLHFFPQKNTACCLLQITLSNLLNFHWV